ncbi:ATP-binding protein [Cryptosporangium arvum]|uniref:ATP-binding protein n=1 Tax=Cryptosporangium arvum TaxID=80871 RepID=UPI0004B4460A|nr:ATP-binding protein [Cryptosporangium arvum]
MPDVARLRLYLRPTADAAPEARRMLAAACAAWSLEHVGEAAAVVVTELVDNAVRHARTDMLVTMAYRGSSLHLSVADRSVTPSTIPVGRGPCGLRLVDTFASGWGVCPVPDGKSVWAALTTLRPRSSG